MVTATGFAVKDDHKKSLNAKAEFEAIDVSKANYQQISDGSTCAVTCHVAAVPIDGAKNNCIIMPDQSFKHERTPSEGGAQYILRI
jgi:hypothetical protein